MSSSIDRVARSHSGSPGTLPVPWAAIAFSSSGRPVVLGPDAVSLKIRSQLQLQGPAVPIQVLALRRSARAADFAHKKPDFRGGLSPGKSSFQSG
jgi:hypothetical protein